MKGLLLLSLLVCVWTSHQARPRQMIFTKLGHRLTIWQPPANNQTEATFKYSWFKRDPLVEKYDLIARNKNCSLSRFYGRRLKRCDFMFFVDKSVLADEGTYKLVVDHKNLTLNSSTYYFKVYVFKQKPVLAPMRMERDEIYFRCDDLENPQAKTTIYYQVLEQYWGGPPKIILDNHPTGPSYLEVHISTDIIASLAARCCSSFYRHHQCTNWVMIMHSQELLTSMTGWRPWCSSHFYGWDQVKDLNFAVTHHGSLNRGQCVLYRPQFLPGNGSKNIICEGKNYTLLHSDQAGVETLFYHSPILNKFKALKSLPLGLVGAKEVEGDYHILNNQTSLNTTFKLMFFPEIRASIGLVRMDYENLTLTCEHNVPPHQVVTISWHVHGIHGGYNIKGLYRTLIFKPDCWYNYIYWHAKFAIRCSVTSGPWQAYSRWFHGNFYRTG